MPGQPRPDGPDDRTVLRALPEDQPDGLSEGQTSNQADLDGIPAGDRPSTSDTKSTWVDYAQSQGIDTDGMTKDEIRDALEGA